MICHDRTVVGHFTVASIPKTVAFREIRKTPTSCPSQEFIDRFVQWISGMCQHVRMPTSQRQVVLVETSFLRRLESILQFAKKPTLPVFTDCANYWLEIFILMAGLIVFWQAVQQDYMVLTDISHFKRWEMLENSAIIPWNLVTTIQRDYSENRSTHIALTIALKNIS